ncbi:hypothetical protein FACS1894125_1610 [Actinomycetota bacterium]|nr:hypothetical protein FACS1894125_1610 [Actinomycetota bacterium]
MPKTLHLHLRNGLLIVAALVFLAFSALGAVSFAQAQESATDVIPVRDTGIHDDSNVDEWILNRVQDDGGVVQAMADGVGPAMNAGKMDVQPQVLSEDGDAIQPLAAGDWADMVDHWEYRPAGAASVKVVTAWEVGTGGANDGVGGVYGLKTAMNAIPTPAAGQPGAYDESKPYVIEVGVDLGDGVIGGGSGGSAANQPADILFTETYGLGTATAGKNVELRNAASLTDENQKIALGVSGNFRHFTTSGPANKLVLKNIALDGGVTYDVATQGVTYTKGGFDFIANTKLTFSGEINNCVTDSMGGAFMLKPGDTLHIYDSKIHDNVASSAARASHGGAIATTDNANGQNVSIWGDTEITHNWADYYGGAIVVNNTPSSLANTPLLEIGGNTKIDDNEAAIGGGLWVRRTNTIFKDNAELTNNTARFLGNPGSGIQHPGSGGGINIDQYNITDFWTSLEIRDNVKISGNVAERAGGGIGLGVIVSMANNPNSPRLILKGGEISDNKVLGVMRVLTGTYSQLQVNEIGSGGGILAPQLNKVEIPADSIVKFSDNWAPTATVVTRARVIAGGAITGVTDNYTSHIQADPNVTKNSLTTNHEYNHLYNNYDISIIGKILAADVTTGAGGQYAQIKFDPGEHGSITQTSEQISGYSTIFGSGTYAAKVGQNLQFTAVPESGYRFAGWSGMAMSNEEGDKGCGVPENVASYCSIPNLTAAEWATATTGTSKGMPTAVMLRLAMPNVEVTLQPRFEKLADLSGITGPTDNGENWNFSTMNKTVKGAGAGDYDVPAALPVVISNIPDGLAATSVSVTLGGTNSDKFDLSGAAPTINAGAQASWTIRPKPNLQVGVYNATLTLSYNDGVKTVTKTATVRFDLKDPSNPPLMQINGNLPTWSTVLGVNYQRPAGNSLVVVNNGGIKADHVWIETCGNSTGAEDASTNGNSAFECGVGGVSSTFLDVSPGQSGGFWVQPFAGLAPGTYTVPITIKYDWSADSGLGVSAGNATLTVTLTFKVLSSANLTGVVADGGVFPTKGINYVDAGVKAITFTNDGQTAATILSVTAASGDNANFTVKQNGTTVPAKNAGVNGTKNDWTVSPNNGLPGGEYTATFTIGYFDGTTGDPSNVPNRTLNITVSFIVVAHKVEFISGATEAIDTASCYFVDYGEDKRETLPTLAAIVAQSPSCNRPGYIFKGWSTAANPSYNTSPDYGDGVQDEYEIIGLINNGKYQFKRLYAIWQRDVTVGFYDGFTPASGGSCTTAQYLIGTNGEPGGCVLANGGKGELITGFNEPGWVVDGVSLPGVGFFEGVPFPVPNSAQLKVMLDSLGRSGWFVSTAADSVLIKGVPYVSSSTSYVLGDEENLDVILNWTPVAHPIAVILDSDATFTTSDAFAEWPTSIVNGFDGSVDAAGAISSYAGISVGLGDDPTMTGYDFTGWQLTCDGGPDLEAGAGVCDYDAEQTARYGGGSGLTNSFVMPNAHITLTDTWTPKRVIFTWLNGAPGTDGTQIWSRNEPLWLLNSNYGAIAVNAPSIPPGILGSVSPGLEVGSTNKLPDALDPFTSGGTNYTFVEWCSDIFENCFGPGVEIPIPPTDLTSATMVAKWRAGNQALNYSSSEGGWTGTGLSIQPDAQEEPVNAFVPITNAVPVRKGYQFVGWSASTDGDLALPAGVYYNWAAGCDSTAATTNHCGFTMPDRSVHLTAQWVPNSIDITYLAPSGTDVGVGICTGLPATTSLTQNAGAVWTPATGAVSGWSNCLGYAFRGYSVATVDADAGALSGTSTIGVGASLHLPLLGVGSTLTLTPIYEKVAHTLRYYESLGQDVVTFPNNSACSWTEKPGGVTVYTGDAVTIQNLTAPGQACEPKRDGWDFVGWKLLDEDSASVYDGLTSSGTAASDVNPADFGGDEVTVEDDFAPNGKYYDRYEPLFVDFYRNDLSAAATSRSTLSIPRLSGLNGTVVDRNSTAGIELYLVPFWQPKTVSVTFDDALNGPLTSANTSGVYGRTLIGSGAASQKPADPVKQGYTFLGWSAVSTVGQADANAQGVLPVNASISSPWTFGGSASENCTALVYAGTANCLTNVDGVTFDGAGNASLELHAVWRYNQYSVTIAMHPASVAEPPLGTIGAEKCASDAASCAAATVPQSATGNVVVGLHIDDIVWLKALGTGGTTFEEFSLVDTAGFEIPSTGGEAVVTLAQLVGELPSSAAFTVVASFVKINFNVVLTQPSAPLGSASGEAGNISAYPPMFNEGGLVNLTAYPPAGYSAQAWTAICSTARAGLCGSVGGDGGTITVTPHSSAPNLASFVGLDGDAEVSVAWEALPQDVRYYDGVTGNNGNLGEYLSGTGFDSQAQVTAQDYVVTSATPSARDGYTFEGWLAFNSGGGAVGVGGGTGTDGVYVAGNTITTPVGGLKLKAVWKAVSYTVSYLNVDGSAFGSGGSSGSTVESWASGYAGNQPVSYTIDSGVAALPAAANVSKVGYQFNGWFAAADLSGSSISSIAVGAFGNVSLYASWSPVSVSVNYVDGTSCDALGSTTGCLDGEVAAAGGTSSALFDGVVASEPLAPVKRGLTFVGWSRTAPAAVLPSSATFASITDGWTFGTTALTTANGVVLSGSGNTQSGALTLYAVYKFIDYTFVINIGQDSTGAGTVGAATTTGGITQGAGQTLTSLHIGDTVYYEVVPNSGKEVTHLTLSDGSTLPNLMPTVGASGSLDIDDLIAAHSSAGSAVTTFTVTADFVATDYAVTLVKPATGDIAASPTDYNAGNTINLQAYPPTGYALDSWSESVDVVFTGSTSPTDAIASFIAPVGNITITATWKPLSYPVRYYDGIGPAINAGKGVELGAPFTGISANMDADYKLPVDVPTRTGYDFAGWQNVLPTGSDELTFKNAAGCASVAEQAADGSYCAVKMTASDVEFKALWTARAVTVAYEMGAITDGVNAGTNGSSLTKKYDDRIGNSEAPSGWSRLGYSLAGWSTSDGSATSNFAFGSLSGTALTLANGVADTGTLKLTLYPVWTALSVDVIWDLHDVGSLNGSTAAVVGTAGSTTVLVGAAPSQPTGVVRDGYDFVRWSLSSGSASGAAPSAAIGSADIDEASGALSVTYRAVWTPKTVAVSFGLNDLTGAASYFAGGAFPGSLPASCSVVVGVVTCSVSFDSSVSGGSGGSSSITVADFDPERAGYLFGGWATSPAASSSGEAFDLSNNLDNDEGVLGAGSPTPTFALYAIWQATAQSVVVYDAMGAVVSEAGGSYMTGSAFIAPSGELAGSLYCHTFASWKLSSTAAPWPLEGTTVDEGNGFVIPAGAVELTPTWTLGRGCTPIEPDGGWHDLEPAQHVASLISDASPAQDWYATVTQGMSEVVTVSTVGMHYFEPGEFVEIWIHSDPVQAKDQAGVLIEVYANEDGDVEPEAFVIPDEVDVSPDHHVVLQGYNAAAGVGNEFDHQAVGHLTVLPRECSNAAWAASHADICTVVPPVPPVPVECSDAAYAAAHADLCGFVPPAECADAGYRAAHEAVCTGWKPGPAATGGSLGTTGFAAAYWVLLLLLLVACGGVGMRVLGGTSLRRQNFYGS